MTVGDRVTVTQGEYSNYTGVMVGVTREGDIVVEFGGRWQATFNPHHLDLAPVTLWNLLVTPGWIEDAEWLRKHEGIAS